MSNLAELKLSVIRTDGGTQPRAELNQETLKNYAEDMQTGAAFPPVKVFYDGTNYWLADGFHRVEAARKINASTITADINQGTLREAVLYSVSVNATHGLRRSNADKRRAVKTLLKDSEWSQWTDREIARRAGVDNKFVGNLRRELCLSVDHPQIQNFADPSGSTSAHRTTQRNGKTYTINTTSIGTNKDLSRSTQAEPGYKHTDIPASNHLLTPPGFEILPKVQMAADQESGMAEIESAHSLPESVQREPAHNLRFTKLTPLVSSESDEYYTSQLLLDAVLKCLGEIDLDPCCNNHISPNVPARQYFTAKQDGLAQPWSGRVFVNPPYTSTVSLWVEKLCTEFESGNVTEAIALVGSQTDTQWFRRLRCYPRCFLSGQLKFSGTENSARFPAVVFHLGSSAGFDRFFDAFQKLGDIFILVEL